jgi:hypothetical protein
MRSLDLADNPRFDILRGSKLLKLIHCPFGGCLIGQVVTWWAPSKESLGLLLYRTRLIIPQAVFARLRWFMLDL